MMGWMMLAGFVWGVALFLRRRHLRRQAGLSAVQGIERDQPGGRGGF